jgi:hypothetical protein
MTCLQAQLKRISGCYKTIEHEARQLKLRGDVGDFEIHMPPATIRVRVRPKTLCQKLNADMTSQPVLKFLTRAWTPHELRGILVAARTIEPTLTRISNRNKSKTFAPTIPDETRPNKIATSLAPCLFAFARGQPDAGASFYEPLIALDLRHHPHRILRIKAVVAALTRWGAPAPRLTSDVHTDLDM